MIRQMVMEKVNAEAGEDGAVVLTQDDEKLYRALLLEKNELLEDDEDLIPLLAYL